MNLTRPLLSLALLALLAIGPALEPAAAAQDPQPKFLIYAGWHGNFIPTPQFIHDNLAFLETRPFHGLVVYLRNPNLTVNATTDAMSTTPMSYPDISAMLDPIKNLPFSRLRENFGYVLGKSPPDFFDDWTIPIQNFANLARALKEAGLKGFFFDNEAYFEPWGEYPGGVAYPLTSLSDYQAQAALRGRQVMEAMVAEFPEIIVLSLHGPYISDPYSVLRLGFAGVPDRNQLLGPFCVGFLQGAGSSARCVDGGELYWCRTVQDFADTYTLRRYDIASDAADCPYIPLSLRPSWPDLITISYGVPDRPVGTIPMNPPVLTTTLGNALQRADRYVWFYTEDRTFLLPESQGGATQEWVDAVRVAIGLPPDPSSVVRSGCGLLGVEGVVIFAILLLVRPRRR
jgi:hypothetical protein